MSSFAFHKDEMAAVEIDQIAVARELSTCNHVFWFLKSFLPSDSGEVIIPFKFQPKCIPWFTQSFRNNYTKAIYFYSRRQATMKENWDTSNFKLFVS